MSSAPPELRGEVSAQGRKLFALIRAGELFGALLFWAALPWWQPAAWLVLVAGAGVWGAWRATRAGFAALPDARRRALSRRYTWLHSLATGSAAYFLYVPGNQSEQSLLGIYLVGAAVLAAMWSVRDLLRALVAAALILLPTALRMYADGVIDQQLGLGVCGLILGGIVVYSAMADSRRIAHERELRLMAEQVRNALASTSLAKSRFFAAVSHDLRQPVHAIGLYLDPLQRALDERPDANAGRAIGGIRQAWRALDDLLSQVLDLTRLDAGMMEANLASVELAPVVQAALQQHGAAADRAGVRLVASVRAGACVLADEIMLRRIVSNLLDNAIKFSSPGRSVAIVLRRGRGCRRLQVRDAGPGIAADQHESIFEEFVQLQNAARDRRQGYGLGLAISRRFAELMQGRLSVRSAPGRGCCMTVSLPLAPSAAIALPGVGDVLLPADAPEPLALPVRNILVVEDDALVADAMVHVLRTWRQHVVHVDTAAGALRHAAFGDIAFCDVRLPGGDSGVDVALQLRALGKQVCLITGETDSALKERAEQLGLRLLTKPLSSEKLRETLQAMP